MASAKTVEDFPVGTEVEFNLDGIDVHGTVESIQLAKKLVDVKIYEPGHRSHCLIVSRAPETLSEAGEGLGPSSYADLQKRVEGERSAKAEIQALADELSKHITDLGLRVAEIETLATRFASLESAMMTHEARIRDLEAIPKPDGGQAASA